MAPTSGDRPDTHDPRPPWDGGFSTEHTEQLPAWDAGDGGPFGTARLPYLGDRPAQRWYRRKGVIVGGSVLAALVVLGAIGAALAPSSKKTDGAGPTAALTSAAAPNATTGADTTTAADTQSSSADDGSWTMPNEVGQVLQDAQDDLQRVSGDPAFFSHSHDLLGDRHQILDRDWKVCTQNVPRGTRVSATEHIDFGVVKLDESCP